MRYALAADVHGNRPHLEEVLSSARRHDVGDIIVAGDYLECRVAKRGRGAVRLDSVSQAVAMDTELWRLLGGCTLVRGNQEERIARLVAQLPCDPALRRLLDAPDTVAVSSLRVMHGHTFDWSECGEWMVPTLDDAVPPDRVIVYGHSHQELVTEVGADGEPTYLPSEVELGAGVALRPGRRYLINLAPVRDRPVWLLYDDEDEVITFLGSRPVTRPRVIVLGGKSSLRSARELDAECLYIEQPARLSARKTGLADWAIAMDYTDTPLLCQVVKAWHEARPFRAVESMTEAGLLPAALLAESLGVRGPALDTVSLLRDKPAMRRRLAERDPGTAVAAATGTGAADIIAFARGHGYPCVVKPPDGTASTGVSLVTGDPGAHQAAERLARLGVSPFLMEPYLPGREFSVETLSYAGQHRVVAITEKFTGPSFVEVGHLVPARVTPAQAAELSQAALELLDAVGLRQGAAHTEVRLTPAGARVIESHPRVGGDRINVLVRLAFGIDMITASLRWALLRRRTPFPEAPHAAASIAFLTPPPGRLTRVSGVAEVAAHPQVVEVEVTAVPGDLLRTVESSHDRSGHVLVTAATPEEALSLAGQLAARIGFTTADEDGNQ
jgi:biotin carboxylase/predicted phosphodiesterase